MNVWILIVILHGLGGPLGSSGNAIANIEFSTQETCLEAGRKVMKENGERGLIAICVKK